jgi:hypothetical protein
MKDNVISLNDHLRKPVGPPHLRVAEVVFLKPATRNEQARKETDDKTRPHAGACLPWDDFE